MSVILDSKFPTLESVAAFLDDNDARDPDLAPEPDSDPGVLDNELDVDITNKQARLDDALAQRRDLSNDDFSVTAVVQFHDLLALFAQKRLLERLIAVQSQLADASQSSSELVAALHYFAEVQADSTASPELTQLAAKGESMIRSQWFDAELSNRLASLREVLLSAKWPQQPLSPRSETINSVLKACLALDVEATFAELAQPLVERIRYNFQRSKDTARADKPEWLLNYVVKQLRSQSPWITACLQHLVDQPVDRLVVALTPVLAETCHKTYTIDAHFVSELLEFISALETKYWCSPETSTDSLLGELLPREVLDKYVEFEERAQLKAFRELLTTGSQAIDYDADGPCAKPTFLAVNIRQMLYQLDYLLRLDPVAVFTRVHLTVIRAYLDYLEVKSETYDRAHSSLARAVGTTTGVGADSEPDRKIKKEEVGDAEYLARIFGSASFFRLVLGRMAVDMVVANEEYTKQEIASLTARFEELRAYSAKRLAKALFRDIQKLLKHYFRVDWQHNSASSSAIMRSAVDSLLPAIEFLKRLCPTSKSDRARISVPLAESLAKMFWQMVIQANLFSPEAARQLRADLEVIWSAFQLPLIGPHLLNLEAIDFLENGEAAEINELTEDQVDGLLRRRLV